MELIITYAPLASFGVFVFYLGGLFIYKLFKHKSVKKAVVETIEVVEKVKEVADDPTILKLREMCKEGIYTVETMYRSYNGKAGAFKLDSLLKDMQVACMKVNVDFDKEYWMKYIQDEVNKMKGVK